MFLQKGDDIMIELSTINNLLSVKKEAKNLVNSFMISDIKTANKIFKQFFLRSDIADSIYCVKINQKYIRVKVTFGSVVRVFPIALYKKGGYY